jgi:hypothetical protein
LKEIKNEHKNFVYFIVTFGSMRLLSGARNACAATAVRHRNTDVVPGFAHRTAQHTRPGRNGDPVPGALPVLHTSQPVDPKR